MIKTFVRPTAEIMSRLLTEEIQKAIDDRFCPANWTRGKLILMSVVLKRFQKFWRRHGDCLPERRSDLAGLKYGEAAFAFSLLAYLQKALSSVALARSDFSEGRGAMDICVVFHKKKYLIEIKLKDKSLEKSRAN
ncbi:MAG: hypothetical protein LBE49_06665 [Deltaproteobacteria bacterium]|jgi:hypothetical protein|nr:hypothetical protein [Deltaproteobacteria bacterium]